MTPAEMEALVNQGAAIDQSEAAATDAAAAGILDGKGNLIAGPIADPADEWMVIPDTLAAVIQHFFPEVAHCYTPESNRALAGKLAAVGEKYGWNIPAGPELALFMASVAFCAPVYMAQRARKAAAENQDGSTPAQATDASNPHGAINGG